MITPQTDGHDRKVAAMTCLRSRTYTVILLILAVTDCSQPRDRLLDLEKRYTTTGTNVRAGRGTSFKVVGTIPRGTRVRVDSLVGNWWVVYDLDFRRVGYVHRRLLASAPPRDGATRRAPPSPRDAVQGDWSGSFRFPSSGERLTLRLNLIAESRECFRTSCGWRVTGAATVYASGQSPLSLGVAGMLLERNRALMLTIYRGSPLNGAFVLSGMVRGDSISGSLAVTSQRGSPETAITLRRGR